MINEALFDKYVKEFKSQNREIAKYVKEFDEYFFNFLKMAVEYVYTLYEGQGVDFSIEPCGDYFNSTYNLNMSPISYLVVYHVKRADIETYLNNKIIKNKYSSKIFNNIIVNTAVPNVPTNDEVAKQIFKFMNRFVDIASASYCNFGTIKYALEQAFTVKVVVAYKYEDGTYVFTDNNKPVVIDFNKVQENIKNKNKETKKEYTKICALFKSFETELLCADKISDILFHKNYFVEELLYNVPNELFEEKNNALKVENIIKHLIRKNLYKLVKLDGEPLTDKARIKFYRTFIKRLELFNNIGTIIINNIFN